MATTHFTGPVDSKAGFMINGVPVSVARGEVVLDGSNPTTVNTGLTSIAAACASIKGTTPPDDPLIITVDYAGGALNIYAWTPTAGTPDTFPLVASTNNTAVISWIAVGTK